MTERNALVATDAARPPAHGLEQEYVTMTVGGHWFGVPVLKVQDVLGHQRVAQVPLASPIISGSINLRGRIVTVIDLHRRLRLPPSDKPGMNVVVECKGELYSLMIDSVGEVTSLLMERFEPLPTTMDALWRSVADGVFRLDGSLLIILDIEKLLDGDAFASVHVT
ncbi:MAG: chemotaxis protein CheW [Rhodospirillales bacterium]|nr:chemotaxis protein CheW [Rhodospirillales bacterium]